MLAWTTLIPGEGSVARLPGSSTSMIINAAKVSDRAIATCAVESNTAQAAVFLVDDKVFGGDNVTRKFHEALENNRV